MSNYNQNQAQEAKTQPQAPAYTAPPPPAGYPVRDGQPSDSAPAPGKTTSRGDGFWTGCCAIFYCRDIMDDCCCECWRKCCW